MAMDDLARFLAQQSADQFPDFLAKLVQPAYLSEWDPITGINTVIISGTQEFVNLALIGSPSDLEVGRVLLLRTAGSPVILGRLRVPPY
jgi:hypothetical protein